MYIYDTLTVTVCKGLAGNNLRKVSCLSLPAACLVAGPHPRIRQLFSRDGQSRKRQLKLSVKEINKKKVDVLLCYRALLMDRGRNKFVVDIVEKLLVCNRLSRASIVDMTCLGSLRPGLKRCNKP